MATAAFVYTDDFVGYKFSDHHPLQQSRLVMLQRMLAAYGVFERGESDLIAPTAADPGDLKCVHSPGYLDALHRLSCGEAVANMSQYGFGDSDNPPFPGMWEASLLYSGASLNAAELVLTGKYTYAFNSSGGLHHAARDRASGFCLVNDNALAAYVALDRGMRVAYIDIDAHHGDGTQSVFYQDPRVLTVSIHETGRTLFPGTGFTDEIGEGDGTGYSINVPMAPYSTDEHYAFAFDHAVEPIVRAYDADFYILQVGADAHVGDPLTHLQLTSQGWIELLKRLLAVAGDKPLIALGGGGYDLKAAARLWALVQATLAGVELPDDVPAACAEAYGIAHLHDEEAEKPILTPQENDAVWAYVRMSVEELKGLVGRRYGL
jgi:acetoin utilization protein AcuC